MSWHSEDGVVSVELRPTFDSLYVFAENPTIACLVYKRGKVCEQLRAAVDKLQLEVSRLPRFPYNMTKKKKSNLPCYSYSI
jgi:hypothetical protein